MMKTAGFVYLFCLTIAIGPAAGAGGSARGGGQPMVAAGSGPAYGNPPLVRLFPPGQDANHEEAFVPYGAPHYGVNVSVGDVDGDGRDEIITGTGPGEICGPHVRGFRRDGTPLAGLNFIAYGTHSYGVVVGAGDLDGDGTAEIITGPGPVGVFGPHVRAFSYDSEREWVSPVPGIHFFAYGLHMWGVNVSGGDIDGDGYDEILTAPGPGERMRPMIRAWDAGGGSAVPIPEAGFFAYGKYGYGAVVAGGDVDGDGRDEIITARGPSRDLRGRVRGWDFDGTAVTPLPGFHFYPWFPSGIRFGAKLFANADLDPDGRDDLVVGAGPDPAAGSPVRVYRYIDSRLDCWFSLEAFPSGWTHGAGVAAGWF
jgi:hypothetical protein